MTPVTEIALKMFLYHRFHPETTTRMEGTGGRQKGSSTGKQMTEVSNPHSNKIKPASREQLARRFMEGEVPHNQRLQRDINDLSKHWIAVASEEEPKRHRQCVGAGSPSCRVVNKLSLPDCSCALSRACGLININWPKDFL